MRSTITKLEWSKHLLITFIRVGNFNNQATKVLMKIIKDNYTFIEAGAK